MARNGDDPARTFPPDDELIYGRWQDVGHGPPEGDDPDEVSGDERRARRRALQREAPRPDLEAAPGEVRFELIWRNSRSGGLDGELIATNICSRAWRFSGKPAINPLDLHGSPLPTRHVVSTEGQIPDYVEVLPGRDARAPVSWGWWDGTRTSATVRVTWDGGTSEAPVTGPTHPEQAVSGRVMTTSSGWWRIAD